MDKNTVFSFILPTKIVFGAGCVKSIGDELSELHAARPLIVTDRGIVASGSLDRVAAALPCGMEYHIFDGTEPNPKDFNVSDGACAYRGFGADSIVAVGGGSPIDCAKAIGVLVANGADSIKAFEGKDVPSKQLPPLISVPTTAGTGSELTFSSVITDTSKKYKMTVRNAYTAPKTAVCDPELTLTVPAPVTAATGVDALTHAIEAFTVTCAEPIGDAAALYAIELICDNLVAAYADGCNLEARSKMLIGSMLAGIAFSHSDVGSVHCIAESLGGLYDLPHGVCNAIFLPYVMEYNKEYCERRYARVAKAMGIVFGDDRGREGECEGAAAAVEAVRRLAKAVNLPSFAELNVAQSDYGRICEASVRNISTQSNPRPMDEQDYMNVIMMSLGQ